jgi:WD40 repeat protein
MEVVTINRHVKILAWIHIVMGGGLLLVALALLASVFVEGPEYTHTLPFLLGLFSWLAIGLLIPCLTGGIGLLRKKRWARALIIFVSVGFLFAFPVGTALGAYGLWVLLKRETEPALAPRPASSSRIDQPRRRLLLAMLSVAAAFVLVVGGGFLLARSRARIAMNGTLGIVAGVALVAASFVIARLLGIPTGGTATVRHAVSAVPENFPHYPQVSGELGITYANDPNMTITCTHLQPFERAMRAAGITVTPGGKSIVAAHCRIHRRGLEGPFKLPESVVYREYFLAERYNEDIPMARLQCTPCGSWISVLHPVECHLSTPWFPAAPAPMLLTAEHSFGSPSAVTAIACSPQGQFIAVAGGTEFLIFDSAQSRPLQRLLPPHGGIHCIAWIDEKILVTGQGVPWFRGFYGGQGIAGPSIFVWNAATGTELMRFGSDLFGVRGIAASPDGRTLLASGRLGKTDAEGSSLDLWEISSGRLLRRLARVEPPAREMLPFFTGVAFTPDGSIALAACDRYTTPAHLRPRERAELPAWWHRGVRAFRLSDGQELDLTRLYNPIRSISVSYDGTKLMFYGARFGMWDLTNGSLIWDQGNGYEIGIAASSDCRLVARGTGYQPEEHSPYIDTAVELYDGRNGELLSVGAHDVPPAAIAFSSDGSLVASDGGKLRFWHWTPDSSS